MSNNDRIYNPVTPTLGSVFLPDATAPTGVSAAQVDHTTLLNKGINTHAQIDAFVTSKGQPNGLAALDGTGNIPGSQLGNAYAPPVTKGVLITGNGTASTNLPPGTTNQLLTADPAAGNVGQRTTPVATLLTIVRPWTEAGWAGDLNALKTTGTLVPMYSGAINGGANNTYFVNLTDHTQQPHAIEITLKNTRTVSLIVDPGNSAQLPLNGGYYLEPGTHTFMVPAPAFTLRSITAGTYTDKWSGGNSITYAAATSALCVYIGVGCPGGPTAYPPGSPFSIGYTLTGSPYLDNTVQVQVQGWTA